MGTKSVIKRINKILKKAQKEGGFIAAIITTYEGLCLAAVDINDNNDSIAAMTSRIHETVRQSENDLGLSNVNEIVLRGENKMKVVVRQILIGEHKFIFAVMAPANRSFRLIMNKTMKKIVPLLTQFLEGEKGPLPG
jgi:predicted regulator of Ras-like GTPase activity (Roadblock/LC7/MglB family)